MELNKYIFPVPDSTYTVKNYKDLLFYIPLKGDFRHYKYDIKNNNRGISPVLRLSVGDSPQLVYETPRGKFKNFIEKPIELQTDGTITSFNMDTIEMSRKTKIKVPFLKQRSHLKKLNNTTTFKSFRNKKEKRILEVDLDCQIIENFKGNSQCEKIDNVIPWLFQYVK